MSNGVVQFLEDRGVIVRFARGGWQPCKCPFHEDRTASASVNTGTGRFHCFVCDISEDLIGLIRREHPGVSYVEAQQKAAQEYGSDVVCVAGNVEPGSLLSGLSGNSQRNGGKVQSWRSGLT